MSRFASILLPLDGSSEAAKGASCALWLADAIGATLHVLNATAHPLPAGDALARLRATGAQGAACVILHQPWGSAEAAVLAEIAAHRIDLVVMSARGESAQANRPRSHWLGSVARAVVERSPVPVILLPTHYRESLPWTSMLAAASGEAVADKALEAAAQLAGALRLRVTVVHADYRAGASGARQFGGYADAPHHEVRHRLEELLRPALAGCAPDEVDCVGDVLRRGGEPASVLLEEVARHRSSVLALGWHGSLGPGRALVLKRLLDQAECALLLARGGEHPRARLKVGRDIE